jgi:hypothetical protein
MADGRGISYYIPPEFRRMGQSAMDLLSAIDPAQGIMRGMAASGRAFDSELPADERKAAAIEAGVETLFPVGMIGMGAAAKQPAKAVLMDILTPTGATKDIAEDTLADPSRRKFLQGAAAAVPVAAVAPDVITDVMTKATKAGGRAAINPLEMAVANIKELRRQIDEQYGILDEIEGMGVGADRNADFAKEATKNIETANFEIIDEVHDAIIGMKPDEFSEAIKSIPDDALETLIEPQYESIMGNQRLVDDGENSVRLAEEVKRRGMHLAKDKNGIDRFPNARAYFDDFEDPVSARESLMNYRNPLVDDVGSLNMTRQTPPDIEEDILELKLTELRRQIEQADRVMRADGKTTKEIDEFKTQKRREMFELQNLPPDMDDFYAKGGLVSGVGSLNRRARDMFRGPKGLESLSRFARGGEADMSAYREALIASESSGDVGASNPSGAMGLTQAMPDTLEDFKRETGLQFTVEEYANSRDLQMKFQDWYEQKTINYIMDNGLDMYIGETIKGVPITMSSMLGMAHLGGDFGMKKFIETGGRYDPDDGYTKLSDYGRKFANMSITGQGSVGQAPSPEEVLMSMPVVQEQEFTDPRGYSPIPQLRPQYMPTEPMPRPRLRPDEEETAQTTPYMGVIPGKRTNLFEKYGGIATLTTP